MQKYKCIIIEDEPLAAEVLQDYILQAPFLELRGVCPDAIFALELLQREKIDLIFLDIHLPRLKGIDFLKALKQTPHIIITTAYQEYALQGYEFSVTDYLLKPIDFGRFMMAVNKILTPDSANAGQSTGKEIQSALVPVERSFFFFNVSRKKVKVFLDDIVFIEGLKEYIRIVTVKRTILTKFPLGRLDDLLTSYNNFLRIHRSFIISLDKVEAYTAHEVEIGGKQLPIGRSYRENVNFIFGTAIG